MRKIGLFFVLLTMLTLFIVSVGTISAQSLDLEEMSEEQLESLLQQIQDILDQKRSGRTADSESASSTILTGGQAFGSDGLSVYKNKKLIIETLPGYMFVQPTKEAPVVIENDSGDTPPEPDLDCPPGYWIECYQFNSWNWNCFCVTEGMKG